jgi:ribosome-associated translation inhibitor RaiA
VADKAVIIGKVSVKVTPDTSDFPDDLEDKLDRIEKKQDGIEVPVRADSKGLADEVDDAVDRAQKQAKTVTLHVDVDSEKSLQRAVAQAEMALDRLKEIDLQVEMDHSSLSAAIDIFNERMDEMDRYQTIKIQPDEHGLEAARKKLQALIDEQRLVDFKIDMNDLEGQLADVEQLLALVPEETTIEMQVTHDKKGLEQVRRELQKLIDEKHLVTYEIDMNNLEDQLAEVEELLSHPDLDPIELKVSPGVAGLKAAEKQLQALVDKKHEVSLLVNQENLEDALEDVQRKIAEAEAEKPFEIRVEPNAKSIEKAQAEIDKLLNQDGAFNFRVDMDPESLHKLREHLDDLKKDYDETELKFEPVIDGVNSSFTAARLAYLARDRWVELKPIVDSKAAAKAATAIAALSGTRMVGDTFEDLWDMVKNIDKNLPLIGSITEAIMGLAAAAFAGTSNLFALAKSLAQIAGAGLALPGILGGFAVGIGASYAVLKDMNKVLPDVKKRLENLQDQMSVQFWSIAAEPIRNAFNNIFVPFSTGILETSRALGVWFSQMGDSVSRHVGGSMPTMFKNLNTSILIASTSADAFGRIIETLGLRGSEYLPRLAVWFGDLTNSFADWLDSADITGTIEMGIFQVNELWRVLANGSGIIADLARAADQAGGSSLTTVANALEDIRETTSSWEFQKGLIQTFKSAHEALNQIANISGPRVETFFTNLVDIFQTGLADVGSALGSLIGGIAEALSTPEFTNGFTDFLDGLRDGIVGLDPYWTMIGDGLGALLSVVGSLARDFLPIFGQALALAGEAAETLGPRISAVATALSDRLSFWLQTTGPLAIGLADAFTALLTPLLQAPGLLEMVVVALAGLKVASVTATAIQALDTAMKTLNTSVEIATTRFTGLDGKLKSVKNVLPGILTVVGQLGTAIAGISIGDFLGDSLLYDPQKANIDQAVKDIQAVGVEGQIASEALTDMFDTRRWRMGQDGIWTLDEMSKKIRELAQVTGEGRSAFEWFKELGFNADNAEDLDRMLQGLDETMAGLVHGGNLQQAAAMHDMAANALKAHGRSAESIEASLPAYTAALEQNNDAASAAADEADRLAQSTYRTKEAQLGLPEGMINSAAAMKEFDGAAQKLNGVTPALLASIRDTSKEFFNLGSLAAGDAYKGLNSVKKGLEEQIKAMEGWADNMATLAQKGISEGALKEIEKLGPSGAAFVGDLAKQSPEKIKEFNDLITQGMAGAVDGAKGELGRLDDEVNGAFALANLAAQTGMNQMQLAAFVGGGEAVNGISEGMLQKNPLIAEAVDTINRAIKGEPGALQLLGSEKGNALMTAYLNAIGVQLPNATAAGGDVLNAFTTGVTPAEGTMLWLGENTAMQFVNGAWNVVDGAKPAGVALATGIQEGATPAEGTMINLGGGVAAQFLEGVWQQVPLAEPAGVAIGDKIVGGVAGKAGEANKTGNKVAGDAVAGAADQQKAAEATGANINTGFLTAIKGNYTVAQGAGTILATQAVAGINTTWYQFYNAGVNTATGAITGINNQQTAAYNAGAALAASANKGYRDNAEIHSPSRVFRELGNFTGQGLVAGLDDMQDKVEDAGARLADAAQAGVDKKPLGLSLSADDIATPFADGGAAYGNHVTINGVPMDHAETTAKEVLWSMRTIDRGGVYRKRSLGG